MKALILFIALAITSGAFAQDIQLHGFLLNGYSDTTYITVWSDGELIAKKAETNKHYSIPLGERPHYTILFECGSKHKYTHLRTMHMVLESIQSDVDFRSNLHVSIYKEKKSSNTYTHQTYGPGGTRTMEYKKMTTE